LTVHQVVQRYSRWLCEYSTVLYRLIAVTLADYLPI